MPAAHRVFGGSQTLPYVQTVLADSPVVFYKLAESSGTAAADSSGNGNNGTYVNTPTLGDASILPAVTTTCIGLVKASSQYVQGPAAPSQLLAPYSVEMWFELDALPGTFCLYSGRDGAELTLDVQLTSTGVHADIGNAGQWFNTAADATFTWATSTLYHYVLTVTSSTYTHYINGSSIGSGSVGGTNAVCWQLAQIFTWAGPDHGSNLYFTGRMQMGALYNTALSGSRVLAHYNAGIA